MKILVLAGTAEARALAGRLAVDARCEVIASLAGATRTPGGLAVPVRAGGFGGEAEQEKYISDKGFGAVIDATHPFAARISTRTQGICARLGLPYVQLLRPGWQPGPGDDWHRVARAEDVAGLTPPGATVFLATGPKSLAQFKGLAGREVICRRVDPTEAAFPIAGGRFVVGRPPFSRADDTRLFRDLGVDWLVVKDAGGAGDGKLGAARSLGIPVAMIDRPPQPPGDKVETIEAALAWLERLL